jgi:hypothetical protein
MKLNTRGLLHGDEEKYCGKCRKVFPRARLRRGLCGNCRAFPPAGWGHMIAFALILIVVIILLVLANAG